MQNFGEKYNVKHTVVEKWNLIFYQVTLAGYRHKICDK